MKTLEENSAIMNLIEAISSIYPHLLAELKEAHAFYFYHSCDVRLRVSLDNNSWVLLTGDPSYDADHKGYWGASTIDPSMGAEELGDVADELIKQAQEQIAQEYEMCACERPGGELVHDECKADSGQFGVGA